MLPLNGSQVSGGMPPFTKWVRVNQKNDRKVPNLRCPLLDAIRKTFARAEFFRVLPEGDIRVGRRATCRSRLGCYTIDTTNADFELRCCSWPFGTSGFS